MADQEVSIKFNSDAGAAIAANNALIESLKQLAAQHTAVKNTFGKGLGSPRTSGSAGNFDTRNRRVTMPSGGSPPIVPPSGGGGGPPPPPLPPIKPPSGGGFENLPKKINESNNSVNTLNNSFSTLGSSIRSAVGQAAAFAGVSVSVAALGNEIYKTIDAVSQLDSAMSAVAAVGGLSKSSAELATLTQQVLDLGSKTQYGAVGAAEGLKELIAAGYASGDASKLLADTLALAATESMAMGRASEIMVAGLQAFGLEVSEGTRLADVLARSANASTASIDDMGEALKYAAPVSKALGVTLEETNAVLAILANNGIRGGAAGRGLASVMAKMVAPTKDAVDALKELGMSANDLNPMIVGVEASLQRLAKLPQVQLVKMFGVENLDISNILSRNASGFADMNKYMSEANVSARSMSEIRMDNLAGDMKKLGAALTELRIEIVGKEYESIRDVVQEFTTYLRENKEVIAENVKKVGDLAVTLGQVVAAYAAIKGVQFIGHLVKSISQWALETKMIDANTGALGRNAGARARVKAAGAGGGVPLPAPTGGGKGGKGGGIGIVPSIGFMLGMAAAPEDAGMVEQVGYGLGGAALGKGLERGVVAIARPLLARALQSSFAAALASVGPTLIAGAATFAAPLTLAAAVVAGGVVAWNVLSDAADRATAAVEGYANSAVMAHRKSVQGAKDEVELAKAKNRIQQEINSIGEEIKRLNSDAGPGYEEQVKKLKETRTLLYSIYNHSEKINQRAQERINLEAQLKADAESAARREAERAKYSAIVAENLRKQAEYAAEFNANYDQRRDTAVSGLSESGQLEVAGDDFAKAKTDAAEIRKQIDAAAKSYDAIANSKLGIRDDPYGFMSFRNPTETNKSPASALQGIKQPELPAFLNAPAFTSLESMATYYKDVLEQAKSSGNIELRASVEPFLEDLDKAIKASVEAGKKIEQALATRDAQVVSLLPTDRQEVIADNNFNDSIKAAQQARTEIDAILAEQGMKPLVDPAKEFKNAADIANYYRRTRNAVMSAGRVDLLTKEPFSNLTESMGKTDAASKEQARIKAIQDQKTMTMKGIEMAEAKANKDTAREEQLRIEMELMKEQQSIMSSMNLSGPEGEAQARKLAARKVGADLQVSLNEKQAELNPLGKMKELGSGATAMNQLFGRASNSGLLETAKAQTELLKKLVEISSIKEGLKIVATVA